MKNITYLLLSVLIFSACTNSQNQKFVSLSGKLENNTDSVIQISNREKILKKIKINNDGRFNDTLIISEAGIFNFALSENKNAPIYLKNGFIVSLEGNADNLFETIKFSGKGSSNSNFIVDQIKESRKMGDPQKILDLELAEFQSKISELKSNFDVILNSHQDLDSVLSTNIKVQNNQLFSYLETAYAKNQLMGKGKPSPKFENYIDYQGGTKSLSSFEGKYVYIDVWATWCGPCIQQIPFMKEIENHYKNKNIVFVGMSTDESNRSGGSWEAAEKKWRDFVKEKNLVGVQLWAGQDFSFQQAYEINAIPRFILIDPKGKIVLADAPRPSDPALKDLLDSLL